MIRLLALAMLLATCGAGTDVTVRVSSPPSPTRSATPAPTLTRAPTPSPTPVASPASSPSGSPTPVIRAPGAIHYVAIGASDTVGIGSLDPANGSWPSRLAALMPPERTYRNLGVSGSLAAQAQRDQLPVAVREQPSIVTIWLAVNDLNAQVPPGVYGTSLAAIVDALVAGTSARVFVGNVPDLRAVPIYAALDPLVLLALIQSYNAQVAAAAAKHVGRVVVVDLFSGSAELTTNITVASDGFHPSDAGYAVIAQRFADAMRTSGIPLRSGS
jgi:lysophospholipase L1-like esterase